MFGEDHKMVHLSPRVIMESTPPANRRQLATRGAAWARGLARALGRLGLTPNLISLASIAFAAAGSLAFCSAYDRAGGRAAALLVAAACGIQLRLLCNMLDGLLAIEGGLKTKTGDLYNEIPDRVADIVLLVGAGYALRGFSWGETLGWAAAILAVLTAYVRLLGGSLGFTQDFSGPMAKQHRMFTLTIGALAAAVEVLMRESRFALAIAMGVIVAGSAVTLIRRTARLARSLEAR